MDMSQSVDEDLERRLDYGGAGDYEGEFRDRGTAVGP